MEYNKLVSVVMPVHNGEKFLREAIESVLNQTYSNFEFIIIENCSTDSSVEIIQSYRDYRIRVIIENDCGQVQAYNRGFNESKGDFIFIHDQDDFSHPKRFEKQLKYAIKNKIDICGSFVCFVNVNSCVIYSQSKSEKDTEIKRDFFYKASAMHNSSILIKRVTIKKNNYWDCKYFPVADSEFYYRILQNKVKFGNVPAYLYFYRIHKSQITAHSTKRGKNLILNFQLNYLLINKNTIILKDYYYYKSLIFYYSNYLVCAFFYNIVSMLHGKLDKYILRYFIIMIFFWLPLKIFRRFGLIRSQLFFSIKIKFNKIFL